MHTQVLGLDRFYLAEDYHQKYYLRNSSVLAREFSAMYPSPSALRDSTAAARVNGYLGGGGDAKDLLNEIESYGLTDAGRKALLGSVGLKDVANQPGGGCPLPKGE